VAKKHNRVVNLPAPYLRRVWLERALVRDAAAYPFCLPFLANDFELGFDRAITIIVGENGTGKSTLLEGIAALAGYDEAAAARDIARSITPAPWRSWVVGSRMHCARAGCRRSPMVGSSAPKASSRSRAIWT
jgi:hypothetical protein